MWARALRLFVVTLALFAVTASPRAALADPPTAPVEARHDDGAGPVLLPGHEADVVALLRPYAPGGPVVDGWRIGNVSIERSTIAVELRHDATRAWLHLDPPTAWTVGDVRSAHFTLRFDPAVPASVRDALTRAVRAHDTRPLWSSAPGSSPRLAAERSLARLRPDGALVALAGLAFLVFALRRALRDTHRYTARALAAVALWGLAVRLALSPETIMNAWSYSRVVPLAGALYESAVTAWLSHRRSVALVDVIFATDLAMASLTPLALFAHARALLRDERAALAAALLIATLPAHVRFSRSDVEFIQSLLASSLTFVALYGALRDDDRRWRRVCAVALPLLSLATYLTRPEAIVFLPLDAAALAVASRSADVPRRRIAFLAALIAAPAFVAVTWHLTLRYRGEVLDGLRIETLRSAARTLVSLRFNTLVNPSVTPPWVLPLAVVGAVLRWRAGERARVVFLVTWLAVFFVVHSYVRPDEVAMQARYHLHLVTPVVLLAAASAPWLLEGRRRALAVSLAGLTLAAPWLWRGFVRDTGFYEMQEFAALRRMAAQVPAGCTVVEFRGVPDAMRPEHHFDSRWARLGARMVNGQQTVVWRVVTADVVEHAAPDAVEQPSTEARAVLAHPPSCARVYLGLSCVAQRRAGEAEAPVCAWMREAVRGAPLARETLRGRVYDAMNVGHPSSRALRHDATRVLPAGRAIDVSLWTLESPAM